MSHSPIPCDFVLAFKLVLDDALDGHDGLTKDGMHVNAPTNGVAVITLSASAKRIAAQFTIVFQHPSVDMAN
jgi:hypothetical protein